MATQFTNESLSSLTADWLVLGLAESAPLSASITELDQTLGGLLSRLIESEDFTGKAGTTTTLLGITEIKTPRILLAGLGTAESISLASLEKR